MFLSLSSYFDSPARTLDQAARFLVCGQFDERIPGKCGNSSDDCRAKCRAFAEPKEECENYSGKDTLVLRNGILPHCVCWSHYKQRPKRRLFIGCGNLNGDACKITNAPCTLTPIRPCYYKSAGDCTSNNPRPINEMIQRLWAAKELKALKVINGPDPQHPLIEHKELFRWAESQSIRSPKALKEMVLPAQPSPEIREKLILHIKTTLNLAANLKIKTRNCLQFGLYLLDGQTNRSAYQRLRGGEIDPASADTNGSKLKKEFIEWAEKEGFPEIREILKNTKALRP